MSSSETARSHKRQSSDQDKLAGLHIIVLKKYKLKSYLTQAARILHSEQVNFNRS